MKKVIKKAGIFDPYLDSLGGGERYTLTLAEFLAGKGWQVDVFWDSPEIKKDLISRFALNLERVNFIRDLENNPQFIAGMNRGKTTSSLRSGNLAFQSGEDVIPIKKNLLNRIKISSSYDLFFWLSDGSVPFLFSKNNLLHFQVPFHDCSGRSLLNRLKLTKINHVVCNSDFTKKFIDQEFGVDSRVIYPPVDIESFDPSKKENLVLSVGRFSQLLQAKRQDVLVSVFKRLCDQGLSGWKLVLAGAKGVGGEEFFAKLKKDSSGYPIEILADIDFSDLRSLYSRAKIFWFASGFGIDEDKNPEKVEHFGMTVVEAMASGCVPLIVGKGGIREIIQDGESGFYWESETDLEKLTLDLIKDQEKIKKISKKVVESSQRFDKKRFYQEFEKII